MATETETGKAPSLADEPVDIGDGGSDESASEATSAAVENLNVAQASAMAAAESLEGIENVSEETVAKVEIAAVLASEAAEELAANTTGDQPADQGSEAGPTVVA